MNKMKYIQFKDILALFKFFVILIPALFFKVCHRRKFWIICEDEYEARDNGYVFFKYMVDKHPDQKVFYAINKNSHDYIEKLKNCKNVIKWGSFKHWLYYLASDANISSQKGGKPNAAVCYLFEVKFSLLRTNRIFLQHGITISDAKWLYYKETKMDLFICAGKDEYEFIKEKFGYPENNLVLLGFPRFDNLNNDIRDNNIILCMPSWRNWLGRKIHGKNNVENFEEFTDTIYFNKWNEFLTSSNLENMLEKYHKSLIFYPHRNMQKFISNFKTTSNRIIIANSNDYDVQTLLKTAGLLITDYSSVFVDFAYMLKPVLFYQFDYNMFRKYQYQEGYFDYANNPMGAAFYKLDNLLNHLDEKLKCDFTLDEESIIKIKSFFGFIDQNNCFRIYKHLIGEKNE